MYTAGNRFRKRINVTADADRFFDTLARQYNDLPKQLQRIAKHIDQHRHEIAFARVQDIASACEVQASAIVRFAQRFGFSGYSDLQSMFRDSLRNDALPGASYQHRIRREIERGATDSSTELARRFIQASQQSLDDLLDVFDPAAFDAAVAQLAGTQDIYVVGMGRSLSVASYFVYALQNLDKRVHFVSGLGGDPRQAMRAIGARDTLVAVSFPPYSSETQLCLQLARERDATILLISDSRLAPIAHVADILLLAREQTAFAFRTLTSTICLAQALFVSLAHYQERMPAKPDAMPSTKNRSSAKTSAKRGARKK